MILDSTECPINRPNKTIQKFFYSGKKKKHTLKYELGISSFKPHRIVWASGPVQGSMHDFQLTKSSGVLDKIFPRERILADMGYIGDPRLITPFKNPQNEAQLLFNKLLGKQRVSVEHVLKDLKDFSVLKKEWRHSLFYHKIVFYDVLNLVTLERVLHTKKQ